MDMMGMISSSIDTQLFDGASYTCYSLSHHIFHLHPMLWLTSVAAIYTKVLNPYEHVNLLTAMRYRRNKSVYGYRMHMSR